MELIKNKKDVVIMRLVSILGNKHVEHILSVLDKHGPLHFGQLKKLTGCPRGTLGRRLKDLEEAGLITTYEMEGGYTLPFKFCKLTELGKKAIVVYKICDDLKKLEKNQKLICCWDKNQQLIYNIIPETDSN